MKIWNKHFSIYSCQSISFLLKGYSIKFYEKDLKIFFYSIVNHTCFLLYFSTIQNHRTATHITKIVIRTKRNISFFKKKPIYTYELRDDDKIQIEVLWHLLIEYYLNFVVVYYLMLATYTNYQQNLLQINKHYLIFLSLYSKQRGSKIIFWHYILLTAWCTITY